MLKVEFLLGFIIVLFGESIGQGLPENSVRAKVGPLKLEKKEKYNVTVQVDDHMSFGRWLATQSFTYKKISDQYFLVSKLDSLHVELLKKVPGVKFIDRGFRKAQEEVVLGDFDLSVNAVTTVHAQFPDIAGDGLLVSIKEKPFDQLDLDLKGRIVLNSQFDEGPTFHATFMATIAVGAGNTSPFAKGAAWQARVTTSDFNQLLPDDGNELTAAGVSVQNHSYGVGLENYYGIESSAYDQAGIAHPKILHVFSSGNRGNDTPAEGVYSGVSGFANLTGQFKVSKNVLTVGSADRFGNVVSLSSKGPAHDGRIKPELIAFGDAGSSEAAAVVSGIALMVQDAFQRKYGTLPDAALTKAILINSSQDVGRPQVDFESGFGNADALNALRIIDDDNFFKDEINQGEERLFSIVVPVDARELKVTLVWNDPSADPFSEKALVNDLDLTLRNEDTNEIWEPWVLDSSPSVSSLQSLAQRGKDRLNNIEQITISIPQPGTYEIRVQGYAIGQGPQPFSLAYQVNSGFEWRYPLADNPLPADETIIIRWRWYQQNVTGIIQYKSVNDVSWQTLGEVDLVDEVYEWTTPAVAGLYHLRMITNADQIESETFAVSKANRLAVGFNCEDDVMFVWNHEQAADEYRLFFLGDKYLEPLLTTTDTFAVFQKSELQTVHFTVVPVFSGFEGARELTINYNLQGTGCYFRSFVAREYVVNDQADFNVELGTVYNLQSAILERLEGTTFEPVQTLTALNSRNFLMTDASPKPGANVYHIRLVTNQQSNILSNTEEILFVRPSDLYVFPNPVSRQQVLSVITNQQGVARVELIDPLGKLVLQAEITGDVKPLDLYGSDQVKPGVYILRIQQSVGSFLSARVVITE